MSDFKYTVVVSDGFHSQRLEMKYEVKKPDSYLVAIVADAFVTGIVNEDATENFVVTEDVLQAEKLGRTWHYSEAYLVDIYYEEV